MFLQRILFINLCWRSLFFQHISVRTDGCFLPQRSNQRSAHLFIFLCQHHMYIYISGFDLWPLRAHISSCWEQFISDRWMALFMPVKPSRSAFSFEMDVVAHECHIRLLAVLLHLQDIRLTASICVSLPLLWKPENIRTAGSCWSCRRAVYGLFYSHAQLTLWVLENKEDL